MAQWDKIQNSGNVEDRRGSGYVGAGTLGTVGVLLMLGLTLFSDSPNPTQIGQLIDQLATNVTQTRQSVDVNDGYSKFASGIVGSTDDFWSAQFRTLNATYEKPRLVLFRGYTDSGCGGATSEVGPHYCYIDSTIYLDETFFDTLVKRFGAKGGDVAQAYVIGHEVGHHVQDEFGTLNQVSRYQARYPDRANILSIRLELQADCYAGMWVRSVQNLGVIEKEEFDQAIDAAQAVGDDRIQSASTGSVHPESWTHGSSVERKQWLLTGYNATSIESCNTFQ